MQIHVVMPGQSLFDISNMYSVSTQVLAEANRIFLYDSLVIGQALVVPISGMYYWVQPGDSLYTLAKRFNLGTGALAKINRLNINNQLRAGLRIYIPPFPKSNLEVNAYIEPYGNQISPELMMNLGEVAPLLTYLAPFSYEIQRDGSLEPPYLDNFAAVAKENAISMMMVVTNLENGQFSAQLGHLILSDDALQDKLLDNIVYTAKAGNFGDVHFDLEHLDADDREEYNDFLKKASELLHKNKLTMSTALAPKTSAQQSGEWYAAHDYRAHGEYADFVVIMTYEWGYSGGPPMAVSPIGPVELVIKYALTEIPAEKIIMGQNLYGYDWTLPYVPGGEYAKAISPQEAIRIARTNNVSISYDYNAQAPYYRYRAADRASHEVWFEDARSISAKFTLLKTYSLRGISYWKLGLPFPQNWLLLSDRFNVGKK